jgi:DNA-binding PadR family transcriptional regulator
MNRYAAVLLGDVEGCRGSERGALDRGVAILLRWRCHGAWEYSVGAIYAVLDKLEGKGFVKSKQGEATPERGGRAKLYFNLTGSGQSALRASLQAIDNLRANTQLVPVLR